MIEEWRANILDLIYKEDLLKSIEDAKMVIDKLPNGIVAEAAKTTINTIQKLVDGLPVVQTCEDAVSRQQAIKTLEKGLPSEPLKSKYTEGITVGFGLAITWIEQLPAVQPQPEIIRCKDCKYRMPYDWMFSEIWRSQNINDYSEDEIGCQYCDMTMKADDFCSRAERRTDEQ